MENKSLSLNSTEEIFDGFMSDDDLIGNIEKESNERRILKTEAYKESDSENDLDLNDSGDKSDQESNLTLDESSEINLHHKCQITTKIIITPRSYQIKLYERAKKGNSIIFLETGKGKTLISILVIQDLIQKYPQKKVVFVANTQQLVEQQKTKILEYKQNLPYDANQVYLDDGDSFESNSYVLALHSEINSSKERTLSELKKAKILVTTAQSFLNKLRVNCFSLSDSIKIIKARIAKQEDRPQILGMTASPVMNIVPASFGSDLDIQFNRIQSNLDSKFVVLTEEEEKESNTTEGVGDSSDIIASFRNEFSEEDMFDMRYHENFHKFFSKEKYLDTFNELEKDIQTKPTGLLQDFYNQLKTFVQETSIVILLELGYDILSKAFRRLLEVTLSLQSKFDDSKSGKNEEKIIYDKLLNYLKTTSEYLDNEKPLPQITQKLSKLTELLKEKLKNSEQKILIFCQMKIIAKYLSEYLCTVQVQSHEESAPKFIRSGHIVGRAKSATIIKKSNEEAISMAKIDGYIELDDHLKDFGDGDSSEEDEIEMESKNTSIKKILKEYSNDFAMNLESQRTAVKNFELNKINILVATDVVEEGFDISSCNIVISYDELIGIKNYIQIKGRARMKESKYYIFVHESKYDEWNNNFKLYQAALRYMKALARNSTKQTSEKKVALKPKDLLSKNKSILQNTNFGEKIPDYNSFMTPEGKCLMNTNWSVDLFSTFCNRIRTRPIFKYFKLLQIGYICCIILPSDSAVLKICCGTLGDTKDSAKRLATFAFCKKLYDKKILNEKLKIQPFYVRGLKGGDTKFKYAYDPLFEENNKKILRESDSKDSLVCPVTEFNPFKGIFTQKADNTYVGYIYQIKIKDFNIGFESSFMNNNSTLGFVYFSDEINSSEIPCRNQYEKSFIICFELSGVFEFNKDQYEKFVTQSRFFDATIRGWDINFFEMFTKVAPEEKSDASRHKKKKVEKIIFSEVYEKEQPVHPFFVQLNEKCEIDIKKVEIIDKYLEKTAKRFCELSTANHSKSSKDDIFIQNFSQVDSARTLKICQCWGDLRKYYILKSCKLEESTDEDNVLSKLYFDQPGESKKLSDLIFTTESLREHLENKLKGNIKSTANMKTHQFYLDEITDYPLDEDFLIHLLCFKQGIDFIKSHFRTNHFQRYVLIPIEEKSRSKESHSLKLDLKFIDSLISPEDWIKLFGKEIDSDIKQNSESIAIPNQSREFYLMNNNISDVENDLLTKKIHLNDLFKALKTSQFDFQENYDRYEFLGDTVIKLLATIQLYCELPYSDENELSVNRAKIICNYNLLRSCVKYRIHEFILGKHEICFPISYENKDQASMEQITDSVVYAEQKKFGFSQQTLNKKSLADVIESITGVFFLSMGLKGAQKFLHSVDVLSSYQTQIQINDMFDEKLHSLKPIVNFKEELQNILGQTYQIRNVNYFIQAFCHSSFKKITLPMIYKKINIDSKAESNSKEEIESSSAGDIAKKASEDNDTFRKIASSINYDRLEFLGDSILDFYAVMFLYNSYKSDNSGKLTIKKSAIVNNRALSLATLKNNLHLHIKIEIPAFNSWANKMKQNMDIYTSDFSKYEDDNDEKHSQEHIKIAADIFEAIIGAIYLDSNQDLNITFKIIDHLYLELMNNLLEQSNKKNDPKSLVNEYCENIGLPIPEIKSKIGQDRKEYKELKVGNYRARILAETNDYFLTEKKLYEKMLKAIRSRKEDES